MTSIERLRSLNASDFLTANDVFDAVFSAAGNLADGDREDGDALEISIRLLEARRNHQIPDGCIEAVEMLAEECGLYPYIEADNFSLFSQTIIEAHAVQLDSKIYLHAKQMQILLWLMSGDNVILSAPTSFGKSMLVDAFLHYKKPHTVLMILPTIALIDETRRRIVRRFGNKYRVVTNVLEDYDESAPTVFILTQERYLQRDEVRRFDLLFVDEFYKLDPTRHDERFETLNIALYKALPRASQCFMAGPHIKGIVLGDRYRGSFRFVQTDYRTVTVNVLDRSSHENKFQAFLADLRSVGDESSIVFTATPGSAQTIMDDLLREGVGFGSALGADLAQWIAENYHQDWPVGRGTEQGIAVHHGRLPRSLGQLFIQLFDQQIIKILICTSTLIEGVNTSAANIFIYDKKINRTDFDFFSFANIRGRVGRMMRHFVGKAFLYHEPPHEVETNVVVPILNDPGASTDYIIMNVDSNSLSIDGRQRQAQLPGATGLSSSILKEHGAIGIDHLIAAYSRVQELLQKDETLFLWSGFPNQEQRIALAEVAMLIAHARRDQTGLHTPRQVAWGWAQLNKISTLPKFLRWFAATFFSENRAKGVDEAFRFLQACEFGFPPRLFNALY